MNESRLVKPIAVLLVEDNPGDADLIRELLPKDGQGSFEITHASRLATAVELVGSDHFDLVLLDLGLPDSAGLDTVRAVRRQAPALPIVVLTGTDDERTGLAAIQEGAQDYVVKGQVTGALLSRVLHYAVERYQHLQRLRESEERYRLLFNAIDEGFCIVEVIFDEDEKPIDYCFLEINAAFEKQTGLIDAQGKRMRELVPEHEEYWFEVYGKIALTGRPARFVNRAEQLHRWYDVYAFRVGEPEDRRVGILFRDISERRQAEELLLLTQFSVDRTADSVFWTDSDARLVFVSDSTCRIHGYSRDEMLAMSLFDLDPSLSRERWVENWKTIKEAAPTRFETTHRTKDGEIFAVEVNSNYVGYGEGEYNCVFARDITERKQAEEERLVLERQLQQSQKLESLGVLAGGIAHDFNNILTGVLGNAELALAELSPSAPGRENLLEITQASHRAAALCRQMLAYSGRGKFASELIDLNALVEDMLGLLKSAISKKALLTLNLAEDLPPVEGDPSQLGQVIMNLVINASEAIGDRDGVITISTGARECSREYLRDSYARQDLAPGFYLTLDVSDTGCGMDQGTKERLFEPFFTTKFTGRGLGLAAVVGIVRGHKGALKVESEPGEGTTFRIRFPTAEAGGGALARERAAEVSDWRGAGTVLLVDDEETIRTLGARMLSRLGFVVLSAADGREALELYAKHRGEIALVLLDLTMPHMDGEETFYGLRVLDPEVRVIMSSGYTEQDITSRFRDEGLVGFLQKPYTMAHLTERLRAALEGTGPAAGECGG
jgi:PAS domain S-box-containing protein